MIKILEPDKRDWEVYRRALKHQRRAKRLLTPANKDKYAAIALHRLNQLFHEHRSGRDFYYDLKRRVLKNWYQQGKCTSAKIIKQELPCHDCGGSGWDGWHGDECCCRCNGTGVYRSHLLYEMTFQLWGKHYTYHQPVNQVDYVTLRDKTPSAVVKGHMGSSADHPCSPHFAEFLYILLRQTLPASERPKMLISWKTLFVTTMFYAHLCDMKWAIRRYLRYWHRQYHPDVYRESAQSDIPF